MSLLKLLRPRSASSHSRRDRMLIRASLTAYSVVPALQQCLNAPTSSGYRGPFVLVITTTVDQATQCHKCESTTRSVILAECRSDSEYWRSSWYPCIARNWYGWIVVASERDNGDAARGDSYSGWDAGENQRRLHLFVWTIRKGC